MGAFLSTLEDDFEDRLTVLAPRSRSLRSEREDTLDECWVRAGWDRLVGNFYRK